MIGALVDQLGLEHITLVAGDWGGPIGLSVALDAPDRFAGLVLTNTWAWPTTGRRRLSSRPAGTGRVLLVNEPAVLILRDRLRELLGADPLSPAGMRR